VKRKDHSLRQLYKKHNASTVGGVAVSAIPLGLLNVEAIQVHHFGPGGYEVFDELLLRISDCIDFSQCSQLRI